MLSFAAAFILSWMEWNKIVYCFFQAPRYVQDQLLYLLLKFKKVADRLDICVWLVRQDHVIISFAAVIVWTPRSGESIFFSVRVFFHGHSRITGLQGKGESISLTPHCHFQPLHRHLDISWVITAFIYLFQLYFPSD